MLRKFLRRKSTWEESPPAVVDMLEGILSNIGIVAALLYACMLAIKPNAMPENMPDRVFKTGRSDFRQYVIDVMETRDIGVHSAEHFNFTVDLGGGIVLDVRDIFLREMATTEEYDLNKFCGGSRFITSMHLLQEHFPMQKMHAWLRMHTESDEGLVKEMIVPQVLLNWGCHCLFGCVVWSVCGIILLGLSGARHQLHVSIACKVTMGMVAIVVILLAAGMVFCFMADQRVHGDGSFVFGLRAYKDILPSLAFFFPLLIIAFGMSILCSFYARFVAIAAPGKQDGQDSQDDLEAASPKPKHVAGVTE